MATVGKCNAVSYGNVPLRRGKGRMFTGKSPLRPISRTQVTLRASYGHPNSSDDRDYDYGSDQGASIIQNPELERSHVDLHPKSLQAEILLQLEEAHRSGELSSDVLLRKLAKEKEALERIASERFNRRDARQAKVTNMHSKVMNQARNLERQLYESDIHHVDKGGTDELIARLNKALYEERERTAILERKVDEVNSVMDRIQEYTDERDKINAHLRRMDTQINEYKHELQLASDYIRKRDDAILQLESERVDNLCRFEQLQTILLKQAEGTSDMGDLSVVVEMIQMRLRLAVDERQDIIERLMGMMEETSSMRNRLTNIIGERYEDSWDGKAAYKAAVDEADSAIELMVGEIEELMQTLTENLDERDNHVSGLASCLSQIQTHTIVWRGYANEVAIQGSFDGWTRLWPLQLGPNLNGSDLPYWSIDLLLYPGIYEYKMVIDGQWCVDESQELHWRDGYQNNIIRIGDDKRF